MYIFTHVLGPYLGPNSVIIISFYHAYNPGTIFLHTFETNTLVSLKGIPTNPRSMNRQHMLENLNAYGFSLNASEIHVLSSQPQVWCSIDNYYECAD